MKIVHISPVAPYNDGWGFQENLLPKYQVKLGHEVTLIISNYAHESGKKIEVKSGTFDSCDGFKVVRLSYKKYFIKGLSNIFWKLNVYDILCEIQPDFIFYHGLISWTIFDVIKYRKQQKKKGIICRVVQDNHLDYNIGRTPNTIKEKILMGYYRLLNHKTQKKVDKVYGVTPWRKQYAEEYYRISPQKTDILIMGADDEKIDYINREKIRKDIRQRYGVMDNEFFIVTGGKIDERKKIHILMEACGNMEKIKLLVFGSVSDELKNEFQNILERYKNIISIGWVDADKVYDYFFAADLACFPGQHSVLWEQACAAKIPCLFARWPGMEHVNNGGNAEFLDIITAESIKNRILELCFTERYFKLKAVAMSKATDVYLYSKIAQKTLEWDKKHDS